MGPISCLSSVLLSSNLASAAGLGEVVLPSSSDHGLAALESSSLTVLVATVAGDHANFGSGTWPWTWSCGAWLWSLMAAIDCLFLFLRPMNTNATAADIIRTAARATPAPSPALAPVLILEL